MEMNAASSFLSKEDTREKVLKGGREMLQGGSGKTRPP